MQSYLSMKQSFLISEYQLSMTNSPEVIGKGSGSILKDATPSNLQKYRYNFKSFLNESQLSMTNGSRVMEKGRGSTFK